MAKMEMDGRALRAHLLTVRDGLPREREVSNTHVQAKTVMQ